LRRTCLRSMSAVATRPVRDSERFTRILRDAGAPLSLRSEVRTNSNT
jgi:hypothetical protein